MSIALTSIFGSEIKVVVQPALSVRQYSGFPGAHGLTAMHLGTRGRQLTITGTLAETGVSYATARAALQAVINTIEAYQWSAAVDITHAGCTYYYAVFDRLRILSDAEGKAFHFTSNGYVRCDFIMYGRCLI